MSVGPHMPVHFYENIRLNQSTFLLGFCGCPANLEEPKSTRVAIIEVIMYVLCRQPMQP